MISTNNSVNYLEQQNDNLQNLQNNLTKPFIRIIEQPARAALRFRYKCESRSAGSLSGVNSTNEKKTYPTIEIANYSGRVYVIVSCVTVQAPHRSHPHKLVGKDHCKKGICSVLISNSNQMRYQFESLGIQCVKRTDIVDSLLERESMKIDPFKVGFEHIKDFSSIDLNAVRLCFEAYIEDNQGKFKIPLEPVLSNIIYDKKTMADLCIHDISHHYAAVSSEQKAILLCNSVRKDSIQIRFYELDQNNNLVWESLANFSPKNVHKQFGISFKIPKYRLQHISQPVECFVQLRRKTDGHTSQSQRFYYLPDTAYQLIGQLLKNLPSNLLNIHNEITSNRMNSLVNKNIVTNRISKNLVNNLAFQNLHHHQTQTNQSSNHPPSTISTPLNPYKRHKSDNEQRTYQCLAKKNLSTNKNNQLILGNFHNFDTLQQLSNTTGLSNTVSINNYSNPISNQTSTIPISMSTSNFCYQTTNSEHPQIEPNYFEFRNQIYHAQQIKDELNQRANGCSFELSNESNLDINFNIIDVNNNNGFVLNSLTKN